MSTLQFTAPTIIWEDTGETLAIDSFQELVIYEAINQKFMHGYITIIDAAVLSRSIVGGEKIRVSFESEFEEGKLERIFVIYGKTNEAVTERGVRVLRYLFISEESLRAASTRLNQHWSKPISGIVEDIISALPLSEQTEGTKTFQKDETDGTFNYIAPNTNADEVLDVLLSMSYDAEGYPFVLYENLDGINFRSFKKLIDQYQSDDLYIYSNALQDTPLTSIPLQQRAMIVEGVQVFRTFDLRSLLLRGSFCSRIAGYDFLNKELIDVRNDIVSQSPYDGNLAHDQFPQEMTSKYIGDGMGPSIFLPSSNDAFMLELAQKLPFKRAVGNLASTIKVQFEQINSVYFHKVGDCLNLEFDNLIIRVGTDNQGNELGTKMSGRYLVTKVAHRFNIINTIVYNKAVEAIKLGYGDSI